MIRKTTSSAAGEIGVLLHVIDEAYGSSAWHGPSLPGMRGRMALREIAGIALHDVYHTGQIQLVKALQGKPRAR